MGIKSFEYVVQGTVQGVNFRSWTVKQAKAIGVTGYVSNHSSGDVTGYAEGDSEPLAKFAKVLERGPSAADVNEVEIKNEQEIEKAKYSSFESD
ncbi:MAG: hypothetical protein CYPHOPRED_002312 [Cyphobasidiales sp. Tagirdzhanova-0007]|nr:MAG: hypothetical protein CYPHOPRED_002310 [Cyphobasidiales sp. Tagirdzhanova-0007]CAD6568068.1 MAG: hypothetical protein CYPHOPRED_002312 [Cyphobasidiales sp. Tagirdzhanova-0007]